MQDTHDATEFAEQEKRNMQGAWLESESPTGQVTAFDWIWDVLRRGYRRQSGTGKVVYAVIVCGIIAALVWVSNT